MSSPLLVHLKQALAETGDERAERIFALRYGWSGQPPQTFTAIAKVLGVSPARIGQLHRNVTRRLWRHGKQQVAGRESVGACGRLYRFLQETIRPGEPNALDRLADLAATHLSGLPQQRLAQMLLADLLLMRSEMRNEARNVLSKRAAHKD